MTKILARSSSDLQSFDLAFRAYTFAQASLSMTNELIWLRITIIDQSSWQITYWLRALQHPSQGEINQPHLFTPYRSGRSNQFANQIFIAQQILSDITLANIVANSSIVSTFLWLSDKEKSL